MNDKGEDCVRVELTTWHGRGTNRVLYNGLMSGDEIKKGDIL